MQLFVRTLRYIFQKFQNILLDENIKESTSVLPTGPNSAQIPYSVLPARLL